MPFSNAFYQKHSIKCKLQIPSAECNIQMPFSKCYHKMPFSKCFHKMPFSKCFYKMPFSKSFQKCLFQNDFHQKPSSKCRHLNFVLPIIDSKCSWQIESCEVGYNFNGKCRIRNFFEPKKSFNRCRQSLLQQHLQHNITQVMISASWPSTLKL